MTDIMDDSYRMAENGKAHQIESIEKRITKTFH